MTGNNLGPDDEQEINDFLIIFLATLIRIEEGISPPQPANNNYPETGDDGDAA